MPGLWNFCQELYAAPGIETLCLQLQDEQDANVLILLWCTWIEKQDRYLPPQVLATAVQHIEPVSKTALWPIRNLRRDLKHQPIVPDEVNREVRQRLSEAELLIEKQMLLQLENLFVDSGVAAIGAGSSKPLDLFFAGFPGISADGLIAKLRAAIACIQ